MDQSTLVEDQIDAGRQFVERFAADGHGVKAAFWIKTAEDGLWFLYVVTDLVETHGPAAAYRAVHAALKKAGPSWVSSSEIKVIASSNPIAKDILALMSKHSGPFATKLGERTVGSVSIEQGYVYPTRYFTFGPVAPMTSDEIGREIVRLLNRGAGILQPSHVVLKDGTAFDGVPFSLQLDRDQKVVAHFVEDGEAAPRVLRLDEINSIT